jgi:hypothetical protein
VKKRDNVLLIGIIFRTGPSWFSGVGGILGIMLAGIIILFSFSVLLFGIGMILTLIKVGGMTGYLIPVVLGMAVLHTVITLISDCSNCSRVIVTIILMAVAVYYTYTTNESLGSVGDIIIMIILLILPAYLVSLITEIPAGLLCSSIFKRGDDTYVESIIFLLLFVSISAFVFSIIDMISAQAFTSVVDWMNNWMNADFNAFNFLYCMDQNYILSTIISAGVLTGALVWRHHYI